MLTLFFWWRCLIADRTDSWWSFFDLNLSSEVGQRDRFNEFSEPPLFHEFWKYSLFSSPLDRWTFWIAAINYLFIKWICFQFLCFKFKRQFNRWCNGLHICKLTPYAIAAQETHLFYRSFIVFKWILIVHSF